EPEGREELEHARGLDRSVRLDGQGEGACRSQPARFALAERLPVVGDGELPAAVAGDPDFRVRGNQLRADRAAHEPERRRRQQAPVGRWAGLAPKSVLITGCSSGIGRATAERLAGRGWTVYASDRELDAIAGLEAKGCRL